MGYKFNFDFTDLSQSFMQEITKFTNINAMEAKIRRQAIIIVKKFKVDKLAGISVADARILVEDLIAIHINNLLCITDFQNTKKRALMLPHCSRKYMDKRCKAHFLSDLSSYRCAACSPDCLVNRATKLGKKMGYDVYVVPGGSCVGKIINKKKYDGVIGVACGDEIRLALNFLDKMGVKTKGIPLIKNGCVKTRFPVQTLKTILENTQGKRKHSRRIGNSTI
jgi:hypothetical protein